MKIKDLKVIPWPDKGWRVQWSIDGLSPGQEIVIKRSSAEEGPWEKRGVVESTEYTFEDPGPNESNYEHFFYKITILDNNGNKVIESKPRGTHFAGNLITQEIIRQHELILKGINAHPGYMSQKFACFKRTIDGTECSYCRNQETGERLVDNCSVCKGTGYIEGWSNPIVFNARWKNQQTKQVRNNKYGEDDEKRRTLWTAAYPILEPGNILVQKGTGEAHEVSRVTARVPDNIIVSQNAQCRAVDRDFVEATLEFPED